MERVHKMHEGIVTSTTVDPNVIVIALGYVKEVIILILLPVVWLFVGRVRKDNEIIHKRIDDCEEGHVSTKVMKEKDKLAKERQDRTISAIVALEKTTKELTKALHRKGL